MTTGANPSQVILVDEADTPVGSADKLSVHRSGLLHRAFSIFLFSAQGLLLQQRAGAKYHSGRLWSNACCGHPRPREPTEQAARRRLLEEMGISCELRDVLSLTYRVEVGDGLVEHELDHLFIGSTSEEPKPDPSEVSGWRWADARQFHADLARRPDRYTAWLPLVWAALLRWSNARDHHEVEPMIRQHLGPTDPS